ncbi:octopamine receptor-like [Anneissia japonica]|uniref:octopamine receptor-like n=1 Tax=Anneissia japonica TaxID=1529436 RepID=UPI00142579EA|nr:octopamine receptor-like [Anneissia japonica]
MRLYHFNQWTQNVYIMGLNYTATDDVGLILDTGDGFSALKYSVVVILSFFCLCGVFGNILVCLAVWKIRSLQVVGNYFVVSLAVADVLVSGLIMPLAISLEFLGGKWIFGRFMCYTWASFDVALSTASIINLGAISMDRYRAVTQPLTYASRRTSNMARKVIINVWVISILVGAPATIFLHSTDTECYLTSEKSQYYAIISSCLSFFIPCFIILILYYKIFKTAQFRATRRIGPALASVAAMYPKTKAQGEGGNNSDQASGSEYQTGNPECKHTELTAVDRTECSIYQDNKRTNDTRREIATSEHNGSKSQKRISVAKERKAAVVLMIVVGTFVACWLPFFTLNVVGAACSSCNFGPTILSVVVWLGWCNSIVNPALYTVFNREFRNAFKKLLRVDRCFGT